jgi:hypothetical protein
VATTYKVLGQVQPAAGVLTTLYTVPPATQVIVSSLIVCNQGASACTFNVRVQVAGAATDPKQYIFAVQPIAAAQTICLTAGLTLGPGDVLSVSASPVIGPVFQLFGQEIA